MQTILSVDHVTKTFRAHGGRTIRAVDDISLTIGAGECVGIIGESGAGKSTLAQIIARLLLPDSGSVTLCGTELTTAGGKALRAAYRNMKMIFQEPRTSFDPRLTLGESLNAALKPILPERSPRTATAKALLEKVGLDARFWDLYPAQVSGGECQRAAIARAIAQKPRLLICDEATSALDVSVQAQVLGLLHEIRRERGLSLLFITHDLALVSSFCDRIYVLHDGKVVEQGTTEQIIRTPSQPYTRQLVDAVRMI